MFVCFSVESHLLSPNFCLLVCLQGGYHGRTFGAMSLTTSKTLYRAGYGPLMSGVTTVPYPYAVHGPIYDEGLPSCCDVHK